MEQTGDSQRRAYRVFIWSYIAKKKRTNENESEERENKKVRLSVTLSFTTLTLTQRWRLWRLGMCIIASSHRVLQKVAPYPFPSPHLERNVYCQNFVWTAFVGAKNRTFFFFVSFVPRQQRRGQERNLKPPISKSMNNAPETTI